MKKMFLAGALFITSCTVFCIGSLSGMNNRRFYKKKKYTVPSGLPKADHHITIFSNEKSPYIKWIATGKKTVEGRVNSHFFKKLKKCDTVVFYNKKKDYVLCKISFLYVHGSFLEMLYYEGVENMLPNMKDIYEAERVYLNFPGSNRVKTCGALAIGIIPIESKY